MRLFPIAAVAALASLLVSLVSVASGDPARMATTGAPVLSTQPASPLGDPFPIRRIPIPDDQLDAKLKELRLGAVVRLPRAELEAKIRAAAEAREVPRLVEANYFATPEGTDLSGEVEWTFLNRRSSPATFSLDSLKLAIHSATWSDGSIAILGAFGDEPGLAIRVPPGRQTLKVKWSAAGSGSDADRQFALGIPSCSTGTLALELPPDRTPTQAAGMLLTGPFPGIRNPNLRQWRFRFGERARLELGVRGPSDTGGPIIVSNSTAKFELGETQLAATFEFEAKTASGARGEWLFQVPPGLSVTDALANDRAAWRFEAASRTLHIQLRQAASSGKFVITATGPVSAGLTPLPAIRPANSVGSLEKIDVRIPPGLAIDRFEPGDFRVVESVSLDGSRTTSLLGTLLPAPASTRRMPSVRVAFAGAEFTTNESLDWRIDSDRVLIAARVEVNVRRGPLFRLRLRTPPGYATNRITSEPEDGLSYSAADASGVDLEFAKPLGSGQRLVLNLEFRGAVVPAGDTSLPLPAFGPVGATEREGRLTFTAPPNRTVVALPIGETSGDTSRGLRFRGREPEGSVNIREHPPLFRASLEPSRGRIRIIPLRGEIESVQIADPSPLAERSWKLIAANNGLSGVSATPLPTLPLFSHASLGRVWTIQLQRPTSESFTLETAPGALQVPGASDVSIEKEGSAPTRTESTDRRWEFESLLFVHKAGPEVPDATLAGTIRSRGGEVLPIGLPDDAEILAAKVGVHSVDPNTLTRSEGKLQLPVPPGTDSIRFEIRYRESRTPPELPDVPPLDHWWAVPADQSAIWPWNLHSTPGPLGFDADHTYFRTDANLIVIPTRQLNLIAIGITVLAAILGWIAIRLANRTLGLFLLGFVLVVGPATLLGPASWSHAAFASLVAALIGTAVLAIVRGWKTSRVRAAAVLLLAPALALAAQPAGEQDVVLLLPNDIVATTQTLLAKLDVKTSEPPLVVGSATYNGRIDDGLGRFTATYTVHTLRDGEHTLELPLSDIRLERVTVDTQMAQPLALKPDVYSLPITGRGPHTVEVRFAVAISSSGPEREIRFGIPMAPDSNVGFVAPNSARQLQVVSRNGRERTTLSKDGNRIEAALGGVRSLHLRWREGAASATANMAVREGCIWDVNESTHRLTACYQIQVKAGVVPAFRFDLPGNLEPTRVAVRSLDSLLVPIAVRDWSLGKEANGSRPLNIELIAPADGRVLVTLECEPRGLPTRQPLLTFPRPVGMTRDTAVYGLRLAGVAVEGIGRNGVIDFAADALTRDFGSVPDLRLTPASHLVAFSPRAGEVAELRPQLKLLSTPPGAVQDVTWSLDGSRAAGRGTFTWSGGDPVSLIEFTLAAAVVEVRGADLAAWSQTDGRVQAWLKKPLKEGTLEWTATAPPASPFEPPLPALLNVRSASQTVRLRPTAGWGIRIDREKGWRSVAAEEREWTFQSEGSLPPPRAQVSPPSSTVARGFGTLEFNSRGVLFRAAVKAKLPTDQPQHLVLLLDGLPSGTTPALEFPAGVLVRERKTTTTAMSWDLDVPAGVELLVQASVSMPANTSFSLPVVDLRIGNRAANPDGALQAFAVTGAPAVVQFTGLKPASEAEVAAVRTEWPGAEGTVWMEAGGRVRLTRPPVVAPTEPVAKPAPEVPAPVPAAVEDYSAWLRAAAWCGLAVAAIVLFLRAPRSTWPEQVGLLGALLGFAIVGQFVWGLVAYGLARNVWLVRTVLNSRK